MAETIFDKIIAGEIPCHKVYEDDEVLAFLDINPLSEGHMLVIPKERAETLDKLSEESAAAIGGGTGGRTEGQSQRCETPGRGRREATARRS